MYFLHFSYYGSQGDLYQPITVVENGLTLTCLSRTIPIRMHNEATIMTREISLLEAYEMVVVRYLIASSVT